MPASDSGSSEELQPIAGIDRLIHEPARLMIMAYLYVVESADFLFLMRQTGLTAGNLSSHTSKLEAAGYIEIVKEFVDKKPHTMLRLTDAGRGAFQEYRERMMEVLR
ncbi:MAG: transcriptional regulator [Methanosarcinales archaeon]|nr:transcriptional regulator [Methanosarcinales archaeon]